MKKLLQLVIDDYAIPAFCSSYKYMYGTLEDFTDLVQYLKNEKKCIKLTEAFDKYVSGDTKVKYDVAYNPMQLMHNCKCIATKDGKILNYKYEFENTWNFLYEFNIEELSFIRVLIKHRNKIVVAIKPTFKNLYIRGYDGFNDVVIGDSMWGFPGIYDYDDNLKIHRARVFLVERIFNKDELELAQAFFDGNELNLDTCFEEIVADG
jgi:hypothetical protein